MNAPARNPDWERATLRQLPPDRADDVRWAEESSARVDRWILWMTLIALPLCAVQLWWRI
jgi:hypothetical protein